MQLWPKKQNIVLFFNAQHNAYLCGQLIWPYQTRGTC